MRKEQIKIQAEQDARDERNREYAKKLEKETEDRIKA
jgi:hypothetical protein